MSKVHRAFVDGEYGQIHYRIAQPDQPTALPLLCLHMSPKSGRSFAKFAEAASNDRIVIAPDYPGYGESDPPPQSPPVTIEDYARNMWTLVDALGYQKLDLFGHHTGGEVAVEMAHQAPDRINKIVIVSAVILTREENEKLNAYFSPIPLDEEGTRFSIMWERINFHRGPGMTLEMMADSFAENLRGGENYEFGHYAAFQYALRFEELIQQLPHRITVLNPQDDLHNETKRVEPLLYNGELIDCPDWGHGFLEAHTEDAVNLVKQSLS